MNADELIALNEEVAGMARAGLPLDQGLMALAKDMGRGQLRSITSAIATDLRSGHTLPQALDRQKGKVPVVIGWAGLVWAPDAAPRVGSHPIPVEGHYGDRFPPAVGHAELCFPALRPGL